LETAALRRSRATLRLLRSGRGYREREGRDSGESGAKHSNIEDHVSLGSSA
jgi:hypothetical protein